MRAADTPMSERRRHSTPFPGFVEPSTGRHPVFPDKVPMQDDSKLAPIEEAPPEEVPRVPATTDDIMAELRASRQDVVTQIAGVTERVTNVTDIVLNAMSQISSIGQRALDLEQTIFAASAMLRTAAEPQREDGPDVVNLKTKLLVVASTLGRIAPRKPLSRHDLLDGDPGKPVSQ